jgi:AcrR family transcriptional regulator
LNYKTHEFTYSESSSSVKLLGFGLGVDMDRLMANVARSTQDVSRRRGRPKIVDDLVVADRIVESARDIFLRAGYDDTTMDMVARHAGVSKRTVYRLFEGKQALFGAVVASHRQSMLDLPRAEDDAPLFETLTAIFHADLDPASVGQRDALTRLFIIETQRHPELAPLLNRHGPRQALDLLTEWLERQVARGRVAVTAPRLAAHLLLNMALGPTGFGDDGQPRWPDPAERRLHVVHAVDLFLHGVVPRARPAGEANRNG